MPAIVNVAVLDCVVVFAVAVIPTLPVPACVPPFAIVSHDALPVTVHVQLAPVVTLTELLPPAAVNVRLVGESVYEHGVPA